MKTTCMRIALLLALASLGGCSGSEEGQVSELPAGASLAAASIGPTTTATPGSTAAANAGATTGDKIEPFRNPFAPPKDPPPPPKVVEPEPEAQREPEPVPEIRQPGEPPRIRLLGFVNIGEPKVLVSHRNELKALAIGDTVEEMKVVTIDSPDVTMLFEENEIKFSLFEQAWTHEGGGTGVSSSGRTQTRPRSTAPSGNTSTSSSVGSTTGDPPRPPSGIPGFGPSAGKPPGFQPPTASETGSTVGGSTGTPPPSLPGLGGEPGAGGAAGSEVPDIFGLDVNAAFGLPPTDPAGP